MRSLRDWRPGNSIRNGAHHQQTVLALRELQAQIGQGETLIGLESIGYPAVVVAAGPKGESDFTGCQYWIKKLLIEASEYADPITFVEDTTDQDLADQANAGGSPGDDGVQATPSILPAHNLAEFDDDGGTHKLKTNGTCFVWIVETDAEGHEDPENLSTLKRLFWMEPPSSVLVKITGNQAGGGKYIGVLWDSPTTEIDLTTDLAAADVGTSGETVLVLNTREVGMSTHDIDNSGTFLPLIFPAVYLHTNATGVQVFAIDGRQGEPCP